MLVQLSHPDAPLSLLHQRGYNPHYTFVLFLFPLPPPLPPFDPSCFPPQIISLDLEASVSACPSPSTLLPPSLHLQQSKKSPHLEEGLCPLASPVTLGPRDLRTQTLRSLPNPSHFHFFLPTGEGLGIAQFESWPARD